MNKLKQNLSSIFIVAAAVSIFAAFPSFAVPTPPASLDNVSSQKETKKEIKNEKGKIERDNGESGKGEKVKPEKVISQKQKIETAKTDNNQKEETKPTQDKLNAIQEIRDQAKLLYNSGKPDESLELYASIPDSEKISEDWMFLANIAQDKDKVVDAVFYLKKAIQADEKNYKAHYNLGNIYFSDNKVNMALDEYRKVLKIKKDFSYAYYNRGCCYLKKKSWYNARYEFGLAIKANPDEPSFYYNLAYTNKMMKKTKKAQEALDMYNKLMTK